MTVYFGDKKIKEMYWGGRKIREAWYEGERVFSGRPVEVMPPISGSRWGARDWLRSKLEEYGENYQTVTEIPFEIDTGEATSMRGMFYGCSSLTTVPAMDTSQVTDASYMFQRCSSLTDGNVRLIGKNPGVSTALMISNSGLTREPFYDSSGQPI